MLVPADLLANSQQASATAGTKADCGIYDTFFETLHHARLDELLLRCANYGNDS